MIRRTMPWRPGAQLRSADCMSAGPDCAARRTGCGSSDMAQAVCCSDSGPALSLVSRAFSAALAQILADATCNEGVSARCWAAIIAPAAASTDRKSASAATGHANPSNSPPRPYEGQHGSSERQQGAARSPRRPTASLVARLRCSGRGSVLGQRAWGSKARAKGRKAYLFLLALLDPDTPCGVRGQEML